MKKLMIFLVIICMMGCIAASAENIHQTQSIDLGETAVITVPEPNGEVDKGTVYFTQEFSFTPEESGTYRFLMSYDEDEQKPYNVFLDVPGAYLEIKNGIEFEATAGETYLLCFQYPDYDGRFPEITFYLTVPGAEEIPKTADGTVLPVLWMGLSAVVLLITVSAFGKPTGKKEI